MKLAISDGQGDVVQLTPVQLDTLIRYAHDAYVKGMSRAVVRRLQAMGLLTTGEGPMSFGYVPTTKGRAVIAAYRATPPAARTDGEP